MYILFFQVYAYMWASLDERVALTNSVQNGHAYGAKLNVFLKPVECC